MKGDVMQCDATRRDARLVSYCETASKPNVYLVTKYTACISTSARPHECWDDQEYRYNADSWH